ncbi:MAG TPA: type II toxin-antitoxin system RelE/ParE family toxin [Allosphingosinicella sp.]|nr:type II toxin-antitoxin system RelE/ParE family toxin [Allosphingosinicella sp.]
MAWRVEFTRRAEKQIDRLDPQSRIRILKKLKLVSESDDPRTAAEPLTGAWTGYWRYRIGDYRAICRIEEAVITIFVIEVGHRREVYR